MPDAPLDDLRTVAILTARNAYVPYTRTAVGAAILLADGTWAPGVRVECASFPLLIPALTTAAAFARVVGESPPVAVALSRPITDAERAVLGQDFGIEWAHPAPEVLVARDVGELPSPTRALDPFVSIPDGDPEAAFAAAETIARKAHIPESGFPVGCVVQAQDGRWVAGCNVEHTDWTRGLCAERVALAMAHTMGITAFRQIVLTCPLDPHGTPCGACRQVLAELAQDVPILMARGDNPPETTDADTLLPGAFRGDGLRAG